MKWPKKGGGMILKYTPSPPHILYDYSLKFNPLEERPNDSCIFLILLVYEEAVDHLKHWLEILLCLNIFVDIGKNQDVDFGKKC